MLETIKDCIENLPSMSFDEYYKNYIFDMQDTMMDLEMEFIVRNTFLDMNAMNRIIDFMHEVVD